MATDVGDPAAVERLRERALEAGSAPQILVNAAGVFGPISLIKDSDPAEWVATITTDAVAAYLTTRAFVGGDDRRRLGADRQHHLGGVAASSRSDEQRLRHRRRPRSTSSPATSPPSWRARA